MKAFICMSLFFYVVFIIISISAALTPQSAEQFHVAQQQQLQQNLLSNAIDSKNDSDSSLPRQRHAGTVHSPRKNPFIKRQVAAGSGIAATTLPPTQYPTVTYAASLYTLGTYTSATWKEFTQTFATTPLGSWPLGPTPRIGTIGLGTTHETVGAVKNNHEKAIQTPISKVQGYK
ncbi:putative secreted effector protein [Erysiphe neolycopersici]|uniref:Putative secreted effector protein n=1 Tax=Erysiphe neolycopersici TaxID=212602 RepID=A0A420I428_9PEZI|nr:putative secreted effector protein [Erysiphe neolycopersici]